MKIFRSFLAITMAFSFLSVSAQSKKNTSETVAVWGNCEMCKARIEKAAKDAGASSASWSTETKLLAVSFNPTKTSLKTIEEKIASVGHDTKNYEAPEEVYNKLHGCCQYDRKATAAKDAAKCCSHQGADTNTTCHAVAGSNAACCQSAQNGSVACAQNTTCCSKS